MLVTRSCCPGKAKAVRKEVSILRANTILFLSDRGDARPVSGEEGGAIGVIPGKCQWRTGLNCVRMIDDTESQAHVRLHEQQRNYVESAYPNHRRYDDVVLFP
jgi:hypothetical protein